MDGIVFGIIAVFLIFAFIICAKAVSLVPWSSWWQLYVSGCAGGVSLVYMAGMKLRQRPGISSIPEIVETYIKARKANIAVTLEKLEIHALTEGHIGSVIQAIVSANRSNLRLDFDQAAAIDLAGRDVNQAVNMCVTPKVLVAPEIQAVAKDGVELRVKIKITVKANLNTIIGGAGEDTILARVGEGIVSAIGSSNSHSEVLKSPDVITKHVLKSGLDSGSAFSIVSIDIADIDVGRNIGAALKNAQAIADKQIAEAKAESRRAIAEALTQENKAAEQEAKAKLVESEMKVPLALAQSFREGKLLVKRNPQKRRKAIGMDESLMSSHSGLGFGDDN